MIKDISIVASPEVASDMDALRLLVSKKEGLPPSDVNEIRILKRSIDARKKKIKINLTLRVALKDDKHIKTEIKLKEYKKVKDGSQSLVIVGAGPAGLFAALKAIELGIRPIVLERGKDVDSRRVELAKISREGIVDENSNYCFGEGGAGAYSDGKLFTRSKKRGNIENILQILHQFGASEDILIDSHPHIGSDKLPLIIKNIRNKIIECGGEVNFEEKVTDLLIADNKVEGVLSASGKRYDGEVILATGHSARDIYRHLKSKNIALEPKGLAIGVRLEHPQETIDRLQYHSEKGRGEFLPPATYNFVTQVDGRGVYSFCMCPGGVIVPSMSGERQSVVNGMSSSARSGKWANSGIVVELHPSDIAGFEKENELEMMALQEHLEKKFFEESNSYSAPAQKATDFIKGKSSETLPQSSYPCGIHPSRMDILLPDEISERLKRGLLDFNKKCPGFINDDAIMIGLESRTSSPVRIPRDKESFQHIEIEGLYPAGEGAGYAGGIVSAAMDGEKCVEAFNRKITKGTDNGRDIEY